MFKELVTLKKSYFKDEHTLSDLLSKMSDEHHFDLFKIFLDIHNCTSSEQLTHAAMDLDFLMDVVATEEAKKALGEAIKPTTKNNRFASHAYGQMSQGW